MTSMGRLPKIYSADVVILVESLSGGNVPQRTTREQKAADGSKVISTPVPSKTIRSAVSATHTNIAPTLSSLLHRLYTTCIPQMNN